MIKDLQKIKTETECNETINWEFRSWLKFNAPDNIDEIVSELSRKYSSQINCQECANCCVSFKIAVRPQEIGPMAAIKQLSINEFKKTYTRLDDEGDITLCSPCPMLKNKSCSIYEERPETCRTYPHLEKPEFLQRLIGVIGSLSICPIAFSIYEELKKNMKWRPSPEVHR